MDWTAVDGMLGGVQTISLAAATTFTLSAPSGSITPGAGPNQAQNAVLKFTGTLSGNAVITLPLPGFYIVRNNCTVGTNYIQFRAVGTGNLIGIPQGRAVKIWNDGTDADFCDAPEVGSYLDLAASTTPAWFAGCTVPPWLICDSAVYTTSVYSALGALLGSTFGGNGITTFGVPDLRARYRIPLDNQGTQGAAGRVTSAGSTLNGTTLGAAGGSQLLQQHSHTVTDPGHIHPFNQDSNGNAGTGGGMLVVQRVGSGASSQVLSGTATTSITINNAGTGTFGNIPPGLIAGITLIKT